MTKEEFKLKLFLLRYKFREKTYVKDPMVSHLSTTVWINPVFEPRDLKEVGSFSKIHKSIEDTPKALYKTIIQLIREHEE